MEFDEQISTSSPISRLSLDIMDPRRYSRRLAAIALFLGCFFITTWLDGHLSVDSFTLVGKSRVKRSAMQSITKKDIDDLLKTQKIRNDVHYQELRDKILDQYGLTEEEIEDDEGKDNKKHRGRTQDSADEHVQLKNIVEEDEDLDDFEDYYSTVLEERAREIKMKVYKCLPKFICEVHAQTPDKITTDLEKEWLKMYSPGLLSEHMHEFQMAAHMGQLFKGYQPTPCHQLYTNCPITMPQLKKFLKTFSVRRTRF